MRLARSMTESVVGRLVAAVVQCELFLKRVLELVIHCSSGVLARLALLGSKVLSNSVHTRTLAGVSECRQLCIINP